VASVNWQTVASIVGIVSAIVVAGSFVVRAMIREELSALDQKYMSKELGDERHTDHGRRIEALEKRPARA
jgi:hypothetical protein